MNENPLHRVKQALRKAIKYQTKEFRDSVKDECQECGEEGYGLDLEVHHIPDFIEIANIFIKKYGEEYLIKNVLKAPTEDIWYFINEKLENEWCEYHLKEATLRLLCTSCHDKNTYKKSISRDITSLKT
jgi:5-methylcytosine-specific restriction endonuclease McrA